MITINTDGACAGNPGKMGIGAVITDGCQTICEISESIGHGTNNIAEYTAVIRALEEAKRLGIKRAEVRSDSMLIVKQLRGEYKVKEPHLRELKRKAQKAAEGMELKFVHVPREENDKADALSKKAIGLMP